VRDQLRRQIADVEALLDEWSLWEGAAEERTKLSGGIGKPTR
jgi:hypothetical protein